MTIRQFLLSAWDWNTWLILLCVAGLLLYGLISRWVFSGRSLYFFSGTVVFFLTLASPLNVLARGYLFSAHMLQHIILILIVPPLLLLGLPYFPSHQGLLGRFTAGGRHPLISWFAGVGAMWLWHVPAFCDAAVSSKGVHAFQTFTLLFLGALFWEPLVGPRREDRLSPLMGIPYLFSACITCSLLGIWITFAPVGVCPVFMNPEDRWGILPLLRATGLTPAADQQIGGLLMWVPACLIYLTAIMALLSCFYRYPKEAMLPKIPNETEKKNV